MRPPSRETLVFLGQSLAELGDRAVEERMGEWFGQGATQVDQVILTYHQRVGWARGGRVRGRESPDDLARFDLGGVAGACRALAESRVGVGDKVALGGQVWQVVQTDPGANPRRALLLADRILEFRPYHSHQEAVTWAESALRDWLNGDYLTELPSEFTARVLPVPVATPNGWSGTSGGKDSIDRVFLPSIDDVVGWLAGGEHAIQARFIATYDGSNGAWWWLRSPGYGPDNAATVFANGFLYPAGRDVVAVGGGVRPALWLNLEAPAAT
jgi:hypothetical protein